MFELEVINSKGIKLVDSKILHRELGVASYHSDWMRRRIENYGFIENEDYYLNHLSTKRGGAKRKEYLLTFDMVKELCMLENNDHGKETRKYFINYEKNSRKKDIVRLAGIQTRKTLTNAIEESGENDRMHGKGYSNFTRLVYQLTGLTEAHKEHKKRFKDINPKEKFRDYLDSDELKRVELAESLIKPMLELDKEYSDIKCVLEPLFKVKELS